MAMIMTNKTNWSARGRWMIALLAPFAGAGTALAQGSRKDDVVFNAQGRPMAGATIRVCTSAATGQPCTPLALIYSDPGLTQALANPTPTDGMGNYTFYAAPGRYEIEISGPSITTKQLPNVILPSDPTAPTFTTVTTTSGISAFSLSLAGNLTVNGSTAVSEPLPWPARPWHRPAWITSGRQISGSVAQFRTATSRGTCLLEAVARPTPMIHRQPERSAALQHADSFERSGF